MIQKLTHDNYFDQAKKDYPVGISVFLTWLDEYKERIDWRDLFTDNIKFHHLPGSLQAGILIEFLRERKDLPWKITLKKFTLRKAFTTVFQMLEEINKQ